MQKIGQSNLDSIRVHLFCL